jgi:hypothetical protein
MRLLLQLLEVDSCDGRARSEGCVVGGARN